jgi:hypothetical protein
MPDHECKFPEVELEEVDETEDGHLKAGMKVLIPCPVCGETPYDSLAVLHRHVEELQAAIEIQEPQQALYHWSPRARLKQIIRYGLRPGMRSTTSTEGYKAPYSCLADTPAGAWALSGQLKGAPTGDWDLWMTYLNRLGKHTILASTERPSGIYEVRVEQRVYKRDLWYVGSRKKD